MLLSAPDGSLFFVQGAHHRHFPPHSNLAANSITQATVPGSHHSPNGVHNDRANGDGATSRASHDERDSNSKPSSRAQSVAPSKGGRDATVASEAGGDQPYFGGGSEGIAPFGSVMVPQDPEIQLAIGEMPFIVAAARAAYAELHGGGHHHGGHRRGHSMTPDLNASMTVTPATLSLMPSPGLGKDGGGGGVGTSVTLPDAGGGFGSFALGLTTTNASSGRNIRHHTQAPPDGWSCLDHLSTVFGIDASAMARRGLALENKLGLDDNTADGSTPMTKSLAFKPGEWARAQFTHAASMDVSTSPQSGGYSDLLRLSVEDTESLFGIADGDLFDEFARLGAYDPQSPTAAQRVANAIKKLRSGSPSTGGAGSSPRRNHSQRQTNTIAGPAPAAPSHGGKSRHSTAVSDHHVHSAGAEPTAEFREMLKKPRAGGQRTESAMSLDRGGGTFRRHQLVLPLQFLFADSNIPRPLLFLVIKDVVPTIINMTWGNHGQAVYPDDAALDFQQFSDVVMLASFVLRRRGAPAVIEAANKKVTELRRQSTMSKLSSKSGATKSGGQSFRNRTRSMLSQLKAKNAAGAANDGLLRVPGAAGGGDPEIPSSSSVNPSAAGSPLNYNAGGSSSHPLASASMMSHTMGDTMASQEPSPNNGLHRIDSLAFGLHANTSIVLSDGDDDEGERSGDADQKGSSHRLVKKVSIRQPGTSSNAFLPRTPSVTNNAASSSRPAGANGAAAMAVSAIKALTDGATGGGGSDTDSDGAGEPEDSEEIQSLYRRLANVKAPPHLGDHLPIPTYSYAPDIARLKKQMERVSSRHLSWTEPKPALSGGDGLATPPNGGGILEEDLAGIDRADSFSVQSDNDDHAPPPALPRMSPRTTQGTERPAFIVTGLRRQWGTQEAVYNPDGLAAARPVPREAPSDHPPRKFYSAHGIKAAQAVMAREAAEFATATAVNENVSNNLRHSSEETVDSGFKIKTDTTAATKGTEDDDDARVFVPAATAAPPAEPSLKPQRLMTAKRRPQTARVRISDVPPPAPVQVASDDDAGVTKAATNSRPLSARTRQKKEPSPARKSKLTASADEDPLEHVSPRERPTRPADALAKASKLVSRKLKAPSLPPQPPSHRSRPLATASATTNSVKDDDVSFVLRNDEGRADGAANLTFSAPRGGRSSVIDSTLDGHDYKGDIGGGEALTAESANAGTTGYQGELRPPLTRKPKPVSNSQQDRGFHDHILAQYRTQFQIV